MWFLPRETSALHEAVQEELELSCISALTVTSACLWYAVFRMHAAFCCHAKEGLGICRSGRPGVTYACLTTIRNPDLHGSLLAAGIQQGADQR